MFRFLAQAPVTFCLLVLLAMVFAGTHGRAGDSRTDLVRLQRAWGAVTQLTWVESDAHRAVVRHPELHGPFDLWDGEWFRVPISALHHADFWHLFLNSLSVALLGRLLETAWGSWRYLAFLAGATLSTMLPESLLGHAVLGYSGVVCALFGALIVLRKTDPLVALQVSDGAVVVGLASLVGMWLLTELGLIHIANVTHFTGLAYGWGVATVARGGVLWRAGLVAAHLLLVVPYWSVTHPVWVGRYHWYRAGLTTAGRIADREDSARLQQAVARDRSLGAVWLLLAQDAELRQQPLEAWRLALNGLSVQPTDVELWMYARRLWRQVAITPRRDDAIAMANELFGDQASSLLAELRRLRPPPVLIAPDQPIGRPAEIADAKPPAWQPQSEDVSRLWSRSRQEPLRVDPLDPRSAVEGELL